MARSLLYLVGSSDIVLNGYSRFNNFYETTKKALKIFQKTSNDKIQRGRYGFNFTIGEEIEIILQGRRKREPLSTIEAPIFGPLLEELRNEEITHIYLFATQQTPPHFQDTLYAAKLLKHFAKTKQNLKNISIDIECITKNPSDYDLMANYFENFFEKKGDQLRRNVLNYISVTAGTPSEVVNLALTSMDLPVEYYYFDRVTHTARKTKLFQKLNRQNYASVLSGLVNSYEYESALRIAKESPFRDNFDILTLLEVMRRRILFNFYGALEESRKIHIDNDIISSLRDTLSDLAQLDNKKLLAELFYRVELCFEKKDFLEGIPLLFSLLDNTLQYLFVNQTDIKIKKINGHFREFNEFIENNLKLKKYLEKDKIKYKDNPSQVTLIKILNWLNKNSPSKCFQELLAFRKKCEQRKSTLYGKISLMDLRNEGPYAHGSRGINEELLKQIYPPYGEATLMSDLKTCMELVLNSTLEINPYKEVNRVITENLFT